MSSTASMSASLLFTAIAGAGEGVKSVVVAVAMFSESLGYGKEELVP
jgi:hypothetical protein